MHKFKQLSYTILFLLFVLLVLTVPTTAKYFQSNLVNFVKTDHKITVPIFSPTEKIEIRPETGAVLSVAGSEDLKLEKGKSYFVTQSKLQPAAQPETAEKVQSGWGVQIMASSSENNAVEFKQKAAAETEAELLILQENNLFKIIAGSFNERAQAESLQQQLRKLGFKGWTREFETVQSVPDSSELKTKKQSAQSSDQKVLNLYNAEGEKIRSAHVFIIEGQFEAEGNKMKGKFQFGPLGNSVLFSYKTNLEELTAYLLQNYFNPGAPVEALKAQAVLYRTALLYQLEIQGARLENLNGFKPGSLDPIFVEAAEATRSEVLIRGDKFYYNNDFNLRKIRKPKAGIVPLAQAYYDYQEIINYYYERSELADLSGLLDTEVKFNAHIERGLEFKEIRQISWSGPRFVTVIDYNIKRDNLSLKPVLAQGVVPGREDLSDLIKKHSALAGVNGGYFHYSGRPLGLLYINGKLVSEPLYNRSALLINKDKELSFARVDWEGEVITESPAKKIKLDGVNRELNQGEIVLFNHFYGTKMPVLPADHYDIVVRDDKILGVENEAGVQTPIPPDGFVLRVPALRTEIKNLIPELKGTKITLNYNFKPNFKEKNILHAVGGGPRLLKDGKIDINGQQENFKNDILNGRAPRTAVALTEDNHLLLLTIDGRQADLSVGMTLEELAQTLKDLGAVEAINLDGGGSARMVIRGFTMSNPSEKRLISNGVIVDQKDAD